MKITLDTGEIEITNWNQILFRIGTQLAKAIREEAKKMKLFDTSAFITGIYSEVNNETLYIGCTTKYGTYLEYGTFDFWSRYGLGNFPKTPMKKKKEMTPSERHAASKGMQPFAVFRRILYNKTKMTEIINRAFTGV